MIAFNRVVCIRLIKKICGNPVYLRPIGFNLAIESESWPLAGRMFGQAQYLLNVRFSLSGIISAS
jgi:hypothetical protein